MLADSAFCQVTALASRMHVGKKSRLAWCMFAFSSSILIRSLDPVCSPWIWITRTIQCLIRCKNMVSIFPFEQYFLHNLNLLYEKYGRGYSLVFSIQNVVLSCIWIQQCNIICKPFQFSVLICLLSLVHHITMLRYVAYKNIMSLLFLPCSVQIMLVPRINRVE